jgi:hypothetical protein
MLLRNPMMNAKTITVECYDFPQNLINYVVERASVFSPWIKKQVSKIGKAYTGHSNNFFETETETHLLISCHEDDTLNFN